MAKLTAQEIANRMAAADEARKAPKTEQRKRADVALSRTNAVLERRARGF
jgi:hypothetical protein